MQRSASATMNLHGWHLWTCGTSTSTWTQERLSRARPDPRQWIGNQNVLNWLFVGNRRCVPRRGGVLAASPVRRVRLEGQ